MITLYVKTHRLTGLKYLGKTERDPYTYSGSGIRWKRELNKYGNDVETEILFQSDNLDEIREKGLYYSELWNIVESNDWANFIEENGSGGDTSAFRDYEAMSIKTKGVPKGPQSEKHRKNNSLSHIGQKAWNKGLKTGPVSEETRKKHTLARTGKKRGKYTLHKDPHGTKHLQGKKASCLCCRKEFDLGNLAKHLRKKENESTI
jgi:hypothetical protein